MTLARVCLDCGTVQRHGARCALCDRAYQHRRRANPTLRYGPGYRARHRAAILAEPWCHNPGCPFPDAGTPSNPLQADHPWPIALGGSPLQELVPLCRSCNARKSGRPPRSTEGRSPGLAVSPAGDRSHRREDTP